MPVRHFSQNSPFKTNSQEFFSYKVFPKNFAKFTEKYVCRRLFFSKVAGCKLKKSLRCRCITVNFCVTFKKDCLVEHLQTVASDILGIPTQGISCKIHIEEMHSFLQLFGTNSFQINFRVLHNPKGVFRTIPNICDEAFLQKYLTAFSHCIFAEMLHQRYLIGFCIRLCSLVFLYFSTSFVWILE